MADNEFKKKTSIAQNLDDKSKKDMFNKFVQAGGQVVAEKKTAPTTAPQDRKVPVNRGGSRSGNGESTVRTQRSTSQANVLSPSPPDKSYDEELGSFTNRLAIKVKCWLARATPFRNDEITSGFMHELSVSGKSALMEFNMVGNDLFGNPEYGPKITKELDKINPMYVEIIAKGHKAYDSSELYSLLEPYQNSPGIPVPIYRIREPLYSLFTKLYYIYPFQETYKKGVNLGYDILQKLENKPALIYTNKKKKFNSELSNFFSSIFEKLYLLIIRNERKNIPIPSQYLERTLGISNQLKVGNRKPGENVPDAIQNQDDSSEPKIKAEKESEVVDPEEGFSKEMKFGLSLMKSLKIKDLRQKYDSRNEYADIPDRDKALLAYLFFKEFDDEYSFVMTTKKIDMNPTIINNTKVDLRQKMVDLYETSRASIESIRLYHDNVVELNKHRKNPGANYIESSKKLTALEQKRSQQSRNVRMTIKDFIEKTRDNLGVIVEDMKTKREIIGNMDDIITLDMVEARKHLNKKSIKQCITESYCYTMALAERLANGDLFGGVVELSPDEMMQSFGISSTKEKEQIQSLLPSELDSDLTPDELDIDERLD